MTQMSANGQTVPDLRILAQLPSGALAPERAPTGVWLHLPRGCSIESRRELRPRDRKPERPDDREPWRISRGSHEARELATGGRCERRPGAVRAGQCSLRMDRLTLSLT